MTTEKSFPTFTSYLLYLEVVVFCSISRLFVFFLPLSLISKFLIFRKGRKVNAPNLSLLVIAIKKVAKYTPWRCKCYEQGLTLKWMLNRRNIASTLFFGISQSESGQLKAHTWVQCGNEIVLGGGNIEHFKIIASFT